MPLFSVTQTTTSIVLTVTDSGFVPNQIKVNYIDQDGKKAAVTIPVFLPSNTLVLSLDVADGWYEITMTETGDGTTETQNFVKTGLTEKCRDDLRSTYLNACCSCEEDEDVAKYLRVDHGLELVAYAVSSNGGFDYKSASCILEGLTAICDSENCKGC